MIKKIALLSAALLFPALACAETFNSQNSLYSAPTGSYVAATGGANFGVGQFPGVGGTNAPLYPLDVQSTGTGSQLHIAGGSTNGVSNDSGMYFAVVSGLVSNIFSGVSYNGSSFIAKAGAGEQISFNNGAVNFANFSGATVGGAATLVPALTISANEGVSIGSSYAEGAVTPPANGMAVQGNVGIGVGTSAVNNALVVVGTAQATSFSGSGAGLTGVPTSALTGTLQAAQEPAFTGDITKSAGSLVTTVTSINGVAVGTPTGTGNVMFSASPTTTGTFSGAAAYWSGKVGIGTSSPADQLDVYDTTGTYPQMRIKETVTSDPVWLTLDAPTSGQAALDIRRAGSQYWDVGMDGNSNFFIYDQVNSVTGLYVTRSSSAKVSIGTQTAVSMFTVNGGYSTGAAGRAVNTGTTSDTIAAGIASTYESANSATTTLTFAAPLGDGERRRICLKNASTVTWAVTTPATAVAGLPTTFIAGQCVEAVYNSASGTPTNAPATSWVVY